MLWINSGGCIFLLGMSFLLKYANEDAITEEPFVISDLAKKITLLEQVGAKWNVLCIVLVMNSINYYKWYIFYHHI